MKKNSFLFMTVFLCFFVLFLFISGSRKIVTNSYSDPITGMVLLPIPSGSVLVGSSIPEVGRNDDEKQFLYSIESGFFMGQTEVTQLQWVKVMGYNPSFFKDSLYPVHNITWYEAVQFCVKLNDLSRSTHSLPLGFEYRLPKEFEWEYACRAGSANSPYDKLEDIGWYKGNSRSFFRDSINRFLSHFKLQIENEPMVHRVARKKPNHFGLYDMLGNIAEWCDTIYVDEFNVGENKKKEYICRGGAWSLEASQCRAARRVGLSADAKLSLLGFRVILAPSRKCHP